VLQKWHTGEADDWRDIVLKKFGMLYFSLKIKTSVQKKKKNMKRENQIRKETLQVDGFMDGYQVHDGRNN